jgi:cytochrome c oxidase subunit III
MPTPSAVIVARQFDDAGQQRTASDLGMWVFLATEVLFFGGLILAWLFCRHWQQAGFDAGARQTLIAFGTTNLVLLLTASLTFSAGLAWIRLGNARRLVQCCWLTAALGVVFLMLKSIEWYIDIADHLFPAGAFKLTGAEADGARLFWSFYFVSTGLHAAHMIAGVGLLCWLALRARKGAFSAEWHTPVEVVGLYWSFVDIVWIMLYPLIYLIGRGT